VISVWADKTITCTFDDGETMDFPCESVARQLSVRAEGSGSGSESEEGDDAATAAAAAAAVAAAAAGTERPRAGTQDEKDRATRELGERTSEIDVEVVHDVLEQERWSLEGAERKLRQLGFSPGAAEAGVLRWVVSRGPQPPPAAVEGDAADGKRAAAGTSVKRAVSQKRTPAGNYEHPTPAAAAAEGAVGEVDLDDRAELLAEVARRRGCASEELARRSVAQLRDLLNTLRQQADGTARPRPHTNSNCGDAGETLPQQGYDAHWEAQLARQAAYKAAHGDCSVPYVCSPNDAHWQPSACARCRLPRGYCRRT
jgi:hypothetical protein